MPKRITPNENTRPVAFTLTESDITALQRLAEKEGCNRSQWIRTRIRREAPMVADQGKHDHLPITKNERSRSWWVRIGKSNPFKVGGHCVACWGEKAPVKTNRRYADGSTIWILDDGTEVRA